MLDDDEAGHGCKRVSEKSGGVTLNGLGAKFKQENMKRMKNMKGFMFFMWGLTEGMARWSCADESEFGNEANKRQNS
jgi:hypothetical protein